MLYRGSPRLVEFFDPKDNKARPSDDTPDLVYASADMGYALCFALEWDNGEDSRPYRLSRFTENGHWRFAVDVEGLDKMRNQQGYLYTIDPDGFHSAAKYGAPSVEWVAHQKVVPLKVDVVNVLESAMRAGVQVYLTDAGTMRQMQANPHESHHIFIRLDGEGACVNQEEAPEFYVSLTREAEIASQT